MKKENLIFPEISKRKQQSIYGANGSGESVVDLPGFELTFDGGDGSDFGDDYDYYGDTFGDDYGDYGGSGGSGGSGDYGDPRDEDGSSQQGHPTGVDIHGDESGIVQTLHLTMEWIDDGNGYTGANINDVFKGMENLSSGLAAKTYTGVADIGGIRVGYYVAAIYNGSDPMDDNNNLDFVRPEFLSDGQVWVSIWDSSSMNSGAARVAILKYASVADYQSFWDN